MAKGKTVQKVFVVKHTNAAVPFHAGRDLWLLDEMAKAAPDCPAEPMGAEDPLFILYTSGSTGKPKGVLHTSGGYLTYVAMTHELVFDYRDGEVYWCTADVGWVTGHSYIVYGPLANGATTLMFEGVPSFPSSSRFWEVIDKHKVNIFYTAPTTLPFFGVKPMIVDEKGNELTGACEGNLCLADSWPGQMRTVYGDHERFEQTYFSTFPGKYFTGDGCKRDSDGYYWITGRVDDVLNVSGHRLGTAEVESALVAHPKVAEAAVVGYPHDIKGQGIYAYVTLNADATPTEELRKELMLWVRKEIGAIAQPEKIQWAPGLPKTRSGKIMRRILRKIAENQFETLGDTSTLADPGVVHDLIRNRVT